MGWAGVEKAVMTDTMNQTPDLLYGASAIADYLGIKRGVVHHLIETARLPHFKVWQDRVCSSVQGSRRAGNSRRACRELISHQAHTALLEFVADWRDQLQSKLGDARHTVG